MHIAGFFPRSRRIDHGCDSMVVAAPAGVDAVTMSCFSQAAIAQLGERQTEDLRVPGSIPGLGILFKPQSGQTSPLVSIQIRTPGIEPGTI